MYEGVEENVASGLRVLKVSDGKKGGYLLCACTILLVKKNAKAMRSVQPSHS